MEKDLKEKTEQGVEQKISSSRLKEEKSDGEYKAAKRTRYDN